MDTPQNKGQTYVSDNIQATKNILETDKPKTRYVLVKNKFRNFILPSILPDRKFDKMIGKALGLLDR